MSEENAENDQNPTRDEEGGWVAPGSASEGPGRTGGEPAHRYPGWPPGALDHGSPWREAHLGEGEVPTGGTAPGADARESGGARSDPWGPARDWWSGQDAAAPPPPMVERARRLSPRSMVVGPINQLRGLLLPIVAGLVLGGFNAWVLAATGVTVVALLVGGFVAWQTTRYEVGEDRLEIRRGLVRRSQRTIPLERVRGVDVTSTLLHRLLGVAVVRIEAASGAVGAGEDGKLDAVETAEADRLRRVLLHRKAVLTGEGPESRPDPSEERTETDPHGVEPAGGDGTVTHFTMPHSWYLYGALSLGYLLTPFVVLATLFGMVQQTAGELATDYLVDWVTASDRGFLTVLAAVLVGVLVLLMPVFAVISYSLTHWGFTLKERDGSLVAERGLFTRRSVTLEKRRIRGYELLDNPLERTRGAVRLRAIVTGLGDAANRAVLLPTGRRARVEQVVDRALALFRGVLRRHPRAALYRRLTRSVGPFVLVLVVSLAMEVTWLAWVSAFLGVLGIPLGVDRYRSLGHGYDGERVSVRSGSLRRQQATVERSAVIGWRWTQTLFQRRSGLADLQVTVGAGLGGYTAQDASLAASVAFAGRVTPEMVRPFLIDPSSEGGTAERDAVRPPSRS